MSNVLTRQMGGVPLAVVNLATHVLELASWYYYPEKFPEWVMANTREGLCKALIAFGVADGDENEEDMINEVAIWAFEIGVKALGWDPEYDGTYEDVSRALRSVVKTSLNRGGM